MAETDICRRQSLDSGRALARGFDELKADSRAAEPEDSRRTLTVCKTVSLERRAEHVRGTRTCHATNYAGSFDYTEYPTDML